jgi:serine/threonine protein phosphatase PrpC
MHAIIELQGKREYMEDRYYIEYDFHNGYDLFVIWDGHGGDFVAEYCKKHMPKMLKDHLNQQGDLSKAMLKTFMKVDDEIDIKDSFMTGTTCLLVLKHTDHIWVANCGDSRGMMNHGKGFLYLSVDHKPDSVSERERIEGQGGNVIYVENVPRVNGELAVSRSIGDKHLRPFVIPIPDIVRFEFNRDNKFIVMATDGLWDVANCGMVNKLVYNEYMNANISDKNVMEKSANQLNNAIVSKISDNTTILIIHIRR